MANLQVVPGQKMSTNVPYMDPEERELIQNAPKVYLWNPSPRTFIDYRGALGRRVVTPCVAGEKLSEPLVIDGWLPETAVDQVDGSTVLLKWLKTSGRKVALEIAKANEKYGVFVSDGPVPTDEEIDAATGKLHATYSALVREADEKAQVNGGMELGDNGKYQAAITKDHIEAARVLGLNPSWAKIQGKMIECEGCGQPVTPNAVRCPHPGCGAILNEEKARKLFPHLFMQEKKMRKSAEEAA
jgi:hypothetical protein